MDTGHRLQQSTKTHEKKNMHVNLILIFSFVKSIQNWCNMSNQEKRLRVLELFSGIGGMHFSLMKAKFFLDNISQTGGTFNYEIIAALDINEGANFGKRIFKCISISQLSINVNFSWLVYRHNFPMVSHLNANICGLKSEVLEKMQIDAIFMSPPCQPFTRQGLQKDLLVNIYYIYWISIYCTFILNDLGYTSRTAFPSYQEYHTKVVQSEIYSSRKCERVWNLKF